jgi:hypothetical protein
MDGQVGQVSPIMAANNFFAVYIHGKELANRARAMRAALVLAPPIY